MAVAVQIRNQDGGTVSDAAVLQPNVHTSLDNYALSKTVINQTIQGTPIENI